MKIHFFPFAERNRGFVSCGIIGYINFTLSVVPTLTREFPMKYPFYNEISHYTLHRIQSVSCQYQLRKTQFSNIVNEQKNHTEKSYVTTIFPTFLRNVLHYSAALEPLTRFQWSRVQSPAVSLGLRLGGLMGSTLIVSFCSKKRMD